MLAFMKEENKATLKLEKNKESVKVEKNKIISYSNSLFSTRRTTESCGSRRRINHLLRLKTRRIRNLSRWRESKGSLKLERSDNGVGRASNQPEGCERNSVDLKEEEKQPQVNLKARTDEPMVCICRKLVFFVPYLLRGRLSTARVLTKTTLKFR
jgi:hypothetical protein